MKLTAFKKIALGTALATSIVSTTGCLGSFALTHKIYSWNQHATGERWVNELIFIGGLILPVYNLSLLADGIIFNSIQWWSGKNPIAANGTPTDVYAKDGSKAEMKMNKDGSIDIQATTADGRKTHLILVKEEERINVLDGQGKPRYTVSL